MMETESIGRSYVGYEQLVDELSLLVSSYPPPFIFINAPTSPKTTSSVISSAIEQCCSESSSPRIYHAYIDATSCFTPRLLYDSVLNTLGSWNISWSEGCSNWHIEEDQQRWNDTFDGFVHGLQALHASLARTGRQNAFKGKGKQKATVISNNSDSSSTRFVIAISQVARLADAQPDLMVPLSKLAELTRLDLTVIFISEVRWEDIRPPLGASPDPFFMDVLPLSKDVMIQRLSVSFPRLHAQDIPHSYHQSLKALHAHYVSTVCDICFPFIRDYEELAYIAAARWPGFVQPLLDDYQRKIDDIGNGDDDDEETEMLEFTSPSEEVRLRLSRLFIPSFTAAMESLYPRLMNATKWERMNRPENDLLLTSGGQTRRATAVQNRPYSEEHGLSTLPRMSKFILIASFLASMNPAKSDLRMFGRGLDEKKRKRRINKSSRKTRNGPPKIPQRLLGPSPFPLDRLIAILGALLEENDADSRLAAPEYAIPGEYTDMEIQRVGIYAAISELTSMCLLHRMTNPERLDGPPAFKCAISHDVALVLAKELDIALNDLMWDPV